MAKVRDDLRQVLEAGLRLIRDQDAQVAGVARGDSPESLAGPSPRAARVGRLARRALSSDQRGCWGGTTFVVP